MGFSISGGDGGWLGILFFVFAVPAAVIALYVLMTASKQAHDTVVEEDADGSGPVA